MEPKYMLIVKSPHGLVVRDAPLPQSEGGNNMRTVRAGTPLMCYDIHNLSGVDYARLVPQNPLRSEWVRVAEADHSIEYVDVIALEKDADPMTDLAGAVRLLADAVAGMRGNPMKEKKTG